MDENEDIGLTAEVETQQEEAAAEQPAASSTFDPSQFVTRDDLKAFAQEIGGMLQQRPAPKQEEDEVPDPTYDPAGYAAHLRQTITAEVVGAMRAERQAEAARQEALRSLGGDAVAPYLEGLSAQDLGFMANHPGLSRLLKAVTQPEQKPQRGAPRSEGSYVEDNPGMGARQQREMGAMLRGFQGQFPDLTMAELQRMVKN